MTRTTLLPDFISLSALCVALVMLVMFVFVAMFLDTVEVPDGPPHLTKKPSLEPGLKTGLRQCSLAVFSCVGMTILVFATYWYAEGNPNAPILAPHHPHVLLLLACFDAFWALCAALSVVALWLGVRAWKKYVAGVPHYLAPVTAFRP